jgi:hypothetical protein
MGCGEQLPVAWAYDNGAVPERILLRCREPSTQLRSGTTHSLRRLLKLRSFLLDLGCPVGSSKCTFRTFDICERQQRRYMWLLIAMHVAEDEGIEL